MRFSSQLVACVSKRTFGDRNHYASRQATSHRCSADSTSRWPKGRPDDSCSARLRIAGTGKCHVLPSAETWERKEKGRGGDKCSVHLPGSDASLWIENRVMCRSCHRRKALLLNMRQWWSRMWSLLTTCTCL